MMCVCAYLCVRTRRACAHSQCGWGILTASVAPRVEAHSGSALGATHEAPASHTPLTALCAPQLGFNDVSAHGSSQIPTPAIDSIFSGGVRLSNYYAQPVCSPTRASMLSGRHVIHTGIVR